MMDKRERKEIQVETHKELLGVEVKEKHKKKNHRRRYIRDLRAR